MRRFVVVSLTSAFLILLAVDAVDDLLLNNRYHIAPELYGLMGAMLAGLFAAQALGGKNGDKNGDKKKGE